jgi:hypothetical protein
MSNYGWSVLENIALIAASCFLYWYTDSLWSFLLLTLSDSVNSK